MSNPTQTSSEQPPHPWQPTHIFYCIRCARQLAQGEGPLLCNGCAPVVDRQLVHYCNICGAPMAPGSGPQVAHPICIQKRYMIQ